MLKFLTALLFVLITSSHAFSEETKLTGPEINALLPKVELKGDGTWQAFGTDGKTNYNVSGRESVGNWEIRGDQYCSNWPPVREWACYDVVRKDADILIWLHKNGDKTVDKIEFK